MKFNENHYAKFTQSLSAQEGWGGSDLKRWWDFVTGQEPCRLAFQRVSREGLKEICADKSFSNKECLGAVMAWGGQNRKHGQTLFARFDEIEPIIDDMRTERIDHIQAYKNFDEVWQKDVPLGMGAAYFTKLIFFCEPSHKGFIMDQWTSKSTNLICDENIVHLASGHVSKKNDAETYDQFCAIVTDIAQDLKIPAEMVEMAMFSKGGRNKEPWRDYVVKQYAPTI